MKQPDFQPPAGLDRVVGHFLPGGIATDFICLPASFTAGETLVLFENRRTSAVVIRRVVAGRPPHSQEKHCRHRPGAGRRQRAPAGRTVLHTVFRGSVRLSGRL